MWTRLLYVSEMFHRLFHKGRFNNIERMNATIRYYMYANILYLFASYTVLHKYTTTNWLGYTAWVLCNLNFPFIIDYIYVHRLQNFT